MRAVLLALALATFGLTLVPTATADLCEVPGCQIVGAAACIANDAKDILTNPKTVKDTLRDCTTGPA